MHGQEVQYNSNYPDKLGPDPFQITKYPDKWMTIENTSFLNKKQELV